MPFTGRDRALRPGRLEPKAPTGDPPEGLTIRLEEQVLVARTVHDSTRHTRRRQPAFNPLVVWLLQSRFHGLASGGLAVVRYRGRLTGVERAFPVQYATAGQEFVILVGRADQKTWWRSFRIPWPITLVHRGVRVAGTGMVVHGDTDEGHRLAATYFARFPRAGRPAGLLVRRGESLDPGAVSAAAAGLTFVRVSPARELPPGERPNVGTPAFRARQREEPT